MRGMSNCRCRGLEKGPAGAGLDGLELGGELVSGRGEADRRTLTHVGNIFFFCKVGIWIPLCHLLKIDVQA